MIGWEPREVRWMTPPDDDMCDCPEMLVNEWLDEDGYVLAVHEVREDNGGRECVDFLKTPAAVAWRMVCPTCRHVYWSGERIILSRRWA